MIRVLSIDPGYERLGVAIFEKEGNSKERLIFSDCYRTEASLKFEDRLFLLGDAIEKVIKNHSPSFLSIENLFMSNNQKTAMRVSEVRGCILYIARKNGLSITEFTPLQIKLALTGDGKSNKEQIMKMTKLLIKDIRADALDDEYDAIAAGLAFFAYKKYG